MWRIDRTVWPYCWILDMLLPDKIWHMGGRFNRKCRWGDSVTDVMIMMFMLESFCLSRIIIPVAWHPVWLRPGGGWDPVWSDVKLSFVVRSQTTGITMYHGPHLHSHQMRGRGLPSSHTWGQYLAGGWLQSIFVHRLRKHSLYKPLDANYFRINWWLHNSNTHSIEN